MDSEITPTFELKKDLEGADIQTFLALNKGAKLIYCEPKDAEKDFIPAAKGFKMKVLVNEPSVEIRRNLTNECLIVTDPKLMLGVDYRAEKKTGIDLLVARPFPNYRKLYQGEARVGRGGEPFGLYRWSETRMLVDEQQQR